MRLDHHLNPKYRPDMVNSNTANPITRLIQNINFNQNFPIDIKPKIHGLVQSISKSKR